MHGQQATAAQVPEAAEYGRFEFADMSYTEIHEYMNDLAEELGYENPNIMFQDLPSSTGGFNALNYETDQDGYVTITGNSFVFNGRKLPDHARPATGFPEVYEEDMDEFWAEFRDDPLDLLHTFYHEVATHGMQFRDIRNADEPWTEDEFLQTSLLHEGMAAYNTDAVSYEAAQDVYDAFTGLVYEAGVDPASALEDISDRFYLERVELTDTEGNNLYQFIAVDRDEIAKEIGVDPNDARVDDVVDLERFHQYDLFESQGYRVDEAASQEVDYAAPDVDTEKIGDHLVRIQDRLLDGFTTIVDDPMYGPDHLPRGYANVDGLEPYGGELDGYELPAPAAPAEPELSTPAQYGASA